MINEWKSHLIGAKITEIHRICNLISFHFKLGKKFTYLHVQSFFRILQKDNVIISSEDIYRCGKNVTEENFEWDLPDSSIFDDCIKEHLEKLCNAAVTEIKESANGDLTINFENAICMQILIDTTETEEMYRIFDDINSTEVTS